MKKFRFTLQPLLNHRRREVRDVENRCAVQAARAAAQRRRRDELLQQLAANEAGHDWLTRHEASCAVRQLAEEAARAADEHEAEQQQLLVALADRRRQVETLLVLAARQRADYEKQRTRQVEAASAEQVLRNWQVNLTKKAATDG